MASADQINDLLPQSQCRLCGYEDCKAYARGIVEDGASINFCPPGGEHTRAELAKILNIDISPNRPIHPPSKNISAFVEERDCIGCTKCLIECPTDAIIGAKLTAHTVVERWCTGCGLCVPVCPVDCISLKSRSDDSANVLSSREARLRYEAHLRRTEVTSKTVMGKPYITFDKNSKDEVNEVIKAAVARKKAERDLSNEDIS